jgi:tetratricopeptide (TPR) repeat protein
MDLGRVYWKQGDWVHAGPEVGRALQLNPRLAEGHLLAGNILLKTRQPENALTEFEDYLTLEPKGEFAGPARDAVTKLKAALDRHKKVSVGTPTTRQMTPEANLSSSLLRACLRFYGSYRYSCAGLHRSSDFLKDVFRELPRMPVTELTSNSRLFSDSTGRLAD